MFRWDSLWALNLAKATPVWAFLSMPLPSASIVFGWPICDNRQKKWKIRTILAINNCSMRQQALIDTREIWRARKLRKSSSRWIQMQLLILEVFLNFLKCFITWLTHTWSMTQWSHLFLFHLRRHSSIMFSHYLFSLDRLLYSQPANRKNHKLDIFIQLCLPRN